VATESENLTDDEILARLQARPDLLARLKSGDSTVVADLVDLGVDATKLRPGWSIADPVRRAEFRKLWESGVPLEEVQARHRARTETAAG
jgi:hypothetical protein